MVIGGNVYNISYYKYRQETNKVKAIQQWRVKLRKLIGIKVGSVLPVAAVGVINVGTAFLFAYKAYTVAGNTFFSSGKAKPFFCGCLNVYT